MKKIRILKICFEQEIPTRELPRFRGAIIAKTGGSKILFHNHIEEGKLRYSYPLIQYKTIGGKGCLICIDEGTEEIHALLGQRNFDILLGERQVTLSIDNLTANNFTLNVWERRFNYSIHKWLALNEENYRKYNSIESIGDKVKFLEQILIGNILSFAKGIDYILEKKIELSITDQPIEFIATYKGVKLAAFNLKFSTNISLPDHIGLGKGVSSGYGIIKTLLTRNQIIND